MIASVGIVVIALSSLAARAVADCKGYYILDARDQYEPQGRSTMLAGIINETLATTLGGDAYSIVYPADPSVTGAIMALDWVNAFLSRRLTECPEHPPRIALLGYGWGANVASFAAADLLMQGGVHASALKAVLLVGSLMHTPYRSGNVDEAGNNSSVATRGAAASDNPPILDSMAKQGTIIDICAIGDPFCDFGSRNISQHTVYMSASTQSIAHVFLTGILNG